MKKAAAKENLLFAVPLELTRVTLALARFGLADLPLSLAQAAFTAPALGGALNESRLLDLFGGSTLDMFDDLGPLYGKASQVLLSRLSPALHTVADTLRLTRLYKDWPPLPFSEVASILDRDIPLWRGSLTVHPHPLGVASLAQVHAAETADGRQWVVKVLKPHAKKRLHESVAALEQIAAYLKPIAMTHGGKRLLKELAELCASFRLETDLVREGETIRRVRETFASRRQKVLAVPEVLDAYSGGDVLTVERFVGTSLADIVRGEVPLAAPLRQKLAKRMLTELLVQVFELGLFHGDPHAGNLILMADGTVGLFDWGLAGELLESDRRHIAAILKAVLALDLEQLTDALAAMAEEAGQTVKPEAIKRELKGVVALVKAGQKPGAKKPSLHQLFEACLSGAARLKIPVPNGLLLMAKSLITIEGLARGIDPDVSFLRAATPVLLRAARPGLKDMLAIGRRLPALARQMFKS